MTRNAAFSPDGGNLNLLQVTSKKDQQQYWARRDEPYRFITSKEFAEAFQSFHVGRKLGDELAVPFDKSKSHPAALTTEKYGIGKKQLLNVCTEREYFLMKRNSFVYIFKFFQVTYLIYIRNVDSILDHHIRVHVIMLALFSFVLSAYNNGSYDNDPLFPNQDATRYSR